MNQTMRFNKPVTNNPNDDPIKDLQRNITVGAGVLAAIGVAGGLYLAQGHESGKSEEQKLGNYLESIAHAQNGDQFPVAAGTFTLKKGATIADAEGHKTQLTEAVDGILNPAWAPEGDTLCYTAKKDMAVCFDISDNKDYITVRTPNAEKLLVEADLNDFTPENAATATVERVEPDGFLFGQVANGSNTVEQYFAGNPTN